MRLLIRDGYVPILESCIIGALAGFSAVLLSNGVNWLGALRVHFSDQFPPQVVLPMCGLVGGLIAGLLVDRVAPEASGSGIPQVRARLDRIVMALDLRIALVKLLGGTIALGSGFFMGREGPTVQLGAALAAPLARWLPTTAEHKRQLIAAGAGAGLTAAFNAPLAGITFVMEELLREAKATTIIITTIACSVACFVLNTFAPPHIHAAAEALAPSVKFDPSDTPFYLLLGVLAGLFGSVFNSAILGALNINRQVLKVPVTIRVALAGLLSGAIISTLPETFHNYAGMRALITAGESNWVMVMVAFLEFYLLTLIAYGSGAPGGLFAPALAIGSAMGYLIGYVELLTTGSGSTAAFALVGMGAFFSAVARTPLTAIVITFEMTSNFNILTPLMFACVISSAVAEMVWKGGLYEHLMRWNGIHLRGPGADEALRVLKAKDVMHKNFDVFSNKALVKDVLPAFGTSSQRGFLVCERDRLVGVVTQTDLVKLESMGNMTVGEIMSPYPVAVHTHDSLEDILFLFSQFKYTWLPVTENDKLVGIILQSDVLKALFNEEEMISAHGGKLGDTKLVMFSDSGHREIAVVGNEVVVSAVHPDQPIPLPAGLPIGKNSSEADGTAETRQSPVIAAETASQTGAAMASPSKGAVPAEAVPAEAVPAEPEASANGNSTGGAEAKGPATATRGSEPASVETETLGEAPETVLFSFSGKKPESAMVKKDTNHIADEKDGAAGPVLAAGAGPKAKSGNAADGAIKADPVKSTEPDAGEKSLQ